MCSTIKVCFGSLLSSGSCQIAMKSFSSFMLHTMEPSRAFVPMEVKHVPHMDVLGARIDAKGSTRAAIAFRLQKAESAMRHFYVLLFSHFTPVKHRFLECSRRVVPCILHRCGCWSWGTDKWHTLHTWEAKTSARILNIGYKPGENTLKWWWCNCIIVARCKFRQMGFESLATRVLRRVFKFSMNTIWKGPQAVDQVVQQCASWRNVLR